MAACDYLAFLKGKIFKEDTSPRNLMPLLHILLYLVTYYRFRDNEKDSEKVFRKLGDQLDELRMLPLPYGLLAHELIEVLDQERYLPGITWVGKFGEEFPFLDHHSMKKEKDNYESSH